MGASINLRKVRTTCSSGLPQRLALALIYPGQTLFLHYETPALFAEVCGMVVGLTVKEDQIGYEGTFAPTPVKSCPVD